MGANESVPHDDTEKKARGALAWPGRENVDPRAPYLVETLMKPGFKQSTYPDSLEFYELNGNETRRMYGQETYKRQAWGVGVAANPWRAVDQSSPRVQRRLAHWGVYLHALPAANQGSASYKIFGMNFEGGKDFGGGKLILEDVWGTPGDDGTGLWKKMVRKDEFMELDEPELKESVIYCSLEEFVLMLQWILRNLVNERVGAYNFRSPSVFGNAYSLGTSNCQHFARRVISALRENDWTNPHRLQRNFSLGEFETDCKTRLKREADRNEGSVEKLRAHLEPMH